MGDQYIRCVLDGYSFDSKPVVPNPMINVDSVLQNYVGQFLSGPEEEALKPSYPVVSAPAVLATAVRVSTGSDAMPLPRRAVDESDDMASLVREMARINRLMAKLLQ